MENYKSNSHKSKEEKRKRDSVIKSEKVVNGKAKIRKKNDVLKLADIFIQEDIERVKNYILMDVLIPNIKKTILESVNMLLFGETSIPKSSSTKSKVSYRSFYGKDNDRSDVGNSKVKSSRYEFNNVIFETRGDAEDVLFEMNSAINEYGIVSVFDLYDFSGIETNHIDTKYGWADIQDAKVIYTRDGYLIKLPRPLPID